MKYLNRLLVVASAAFFIAGAQAQNAGTVTNHAFAIGKGAGVQGYGSLVLGSGQIAVGQASADPSAITLSGDVTMNASGVTAIGANKITNSQLRQSGALALIGRSANSAGNVADIQATAGSSCVFVESSSSLTCAAITAANIAANAVTNAKLAQMPANTVKCNPTGSTANAQDCTSLPLAIGGLGGSQSAATANQVPVYPGSSGAASPTSAASWFDAFCSTTIGNFWVRQTGGWGCTSLGYANPVWWGADPAGSSDSTSAFNSAEATGLPIRWPSGTFKLLSAESYNLSSGCFCMTGAGSNLTFLNWPNASGGITVTKTGTNVAASIRELSLTTSQVSSGNAIKLVGTSHNIPYPPQSDIQDVQIHGDDFAPNSGSHCWANGIWDHDWSAVFVKNVNTYGTWGAPGTAGCGVGLLWEGDAATIDYAINLNVVSSAFNYHVNGIQFQSYWQGFACLLCNFNGEEGNNSILVPGSQTGVLAGFWITASQFNTAGNQINFGTSVASGAIANSTITTFTNSSNGIVGIASEMQIVGNTFNSAGGTTQSGVVLSSGSTNGTVIGNTFTNLSNGTVLSAGSSLWTVALNNYNTVSTKVSNGGTNNSVGSQAAGAMTGVVP